jgi:hypothetical protein
MKLFASVEILIFVKKPPSHQISAIGRNAAGASMLQSSSGSNTAFAALGCNAAFAATVCPGIGGEGERSATSTSIASIASKWTIPNTTHFRWPLFGDCSVTTVFGVAVGRLRLQCLQTIAASWMSSAQKGHFFTRNLQTIEWSPRGD